MVLELLKTFNKMEKTIMKKFVLLLLLSAINLFAQATLYTPNGKSFQTVDGNWWSYNSSDFEAWKNNNFGPGKPYPNSSVVGTWENNIWEYNCHSFAWNNWQGAERWNSENDVWKLGKPSPTDLFWLNPPDIFFSDNDNPIGIVSYVGSYATESSICTYSGNHSARIVGDGTRCISKWGSAGIVNHPPTEVPIDYYSVNAYYKINPAYRPIGSGDLAGRDWQTIANALSGIPSGGLIEVLSGTQTLNGNISIPSGVTLKIKTSATINPNGYSITTSGGTLTVQSGATINGAVLLTGTTYNAIYSTMQAALSAAVSGQTVGVNIAQTVSSIFTIQSGITLSFGSNATVTFSSGRRISVNGNLLANGSTFQGNGTRGSWIGLCFNSGSSGSIQSSTITDAQNGISFYSGSSGSVQSTTITNGGNWSLYE